jgi:hypothetical protein
LRRRFDHFNRTYKGFTIYSFNGIGTTLAHQSTWIDHLDPQALSGIPTANHVIPEVAGCGIQAADSGFVGIRTDLRDKHKIPQFWRRCEQFRRLLRGLPMKAGRLTRLDSALNSIRVESFFAEAKIGAIEVYQMRPDNFTEVEAPEH